MNVTNLITFSKGYQKEGVKRSSIVLVLVLVLDCLSLSERGKTRGTISFNATRLGGANG